MILSSKHAKELTAVETPVRRSERFGSANNSSNKFLFPPECFIFGIYRKQCSKHDEYNRILLKDGEQRIRLAAEHKLPLFYRKNKAIDLISSELRFHESCYKTFTYGYSNSFTEKKLDLPLLNKSRKTNKGKFGQIVMNEIDTAETLEVKKEHTAYIVDSMALIRTITKYLIRSKELRGKWYLIFQRVTVVSILLLISTSERLKRGISTKVIVNI